MPLLDTLVNLLSPRKTRQNTHRHELPPLGRSIVPIFTYDIFEALKQQNRTERRLPPVATAGESALVAPQPNDPDLDLHHIWENGRKIRLLGTLQRERAARLQPVLEARAKAEALSVANLLLDASPKRPWSAAELVAAREVEPEDRLYDHHELVCSGSSYNFKTVDWDGSEAMPLVDRLKLVMGVAGGELQEDDAPTVIREATEAFRSALDIARSGSTDPTSLSAGVVYNGERAQETRLRVHDTLAVDYLIKHVAIGRLCTFANDLFSAFSPRAFGLAKTRTQRLYNSQPHLERLFPGAWTNVTFDLGPQATRPQDPRRTSWCWLAITALGDFDPDQGGFLIFWDLGRVLRFPPGSTVLIPPILRYSISNIQEGETRYSITHYCAAPVGWERWPDATDLFSKLHQLSSLRT